MEKLVMKRSASDNKYLHRDFHKSMDLGIRYIGERYGDNGVKEYLREFAASYYAPLAAKIAAEGLSALAEHIQSIYEMEEMPEALRLELSPTRLVVHVEKCPALSHFARIGYTASPWYIEATRTVNETIANLSNLRYYQYQYDSVTGKCQYAFEKRDA